MAASLWLDDESSSSGSRQNNQKDKNEDLFVFGYACKLFRDDEKAKDIDSGKLLIPWMGDENLMIDRYDGRGHLFDLATHDADRVVKRTVEMSEYDLAIEKVCEEERYLELHRDLQEEAMYEEEEWKRYYLALQEGYQAVGFSYDNSQGGTGDQALSLVQGDEIKEEKPFVVPEELQVPPDMQKPTSSKQHARIEKTANFIAKQGIQMEIMVKTKQSGNPQFDFLHFENELNPFYKHVVEMMKCGRYKYKPLEEEKEKEASQPDDGYLHPSLSTTALPPPPPPPSKPIELPKVSIHDTPYGALIQSIKRSNITAYESEKTQELVPSSAPTISDGGDCLPVAGPTTQDSIGQQQSQQSFTGPALMDSLFPNPDSPAESSRRSRKKKQRRRSSSSDSSSSSSLSSSSSSSSSRSKSSRRKRRQSPTPPPPPPIARAEGPSAIVPPTPDMQPIVDRMALYVAKNGMEFEIVVKGRNDPRFQFLNEYHALFPYYSLKREMFVKELGKDIRKPDKKEEKAKKEDDSSHGGARSVSFSIKAKAKESEAGPPDKPKPKVFEYDDSSEGEEGKQSDQQSGSGNVSRSATPPVKVLGNEESIKQSVEEKLKDKLASAVKERISQSNKEKTLQMERKKKAAMFLNMLKSKPQASPPTNASIMEDSASLYVGESAPSIVYEYENQPRPVKVERSRSPRERHHRRRRSPTPPSAYSQDKKPVPAPYQSSRDPWTSSLSGRDRDRDREGAWQRWGGGRDATHSRSSPNRKKKHKRSRSRSPEKAEKSKRPKEKSKTKSKDKKKKRGRSKEREGKKKSTRRDKSDSSNSDLEVQEYLSSSRLAASSSLSHVTNSNGSRLSGMSPVVQDIALPDIPTPSDKTSSKSLHNPVERPGASDSVLSGSVDDSSNLGTKDCSTPQTTESATASSSSTDFMAKVRAMLKKSREMALKEDSFSFEDT